MKDEKLYELLNQMTLEEKIGQLIQVAGEVFLMNNTDIVTGPLKELELSEQMLYNVGSILYSRDRKSKKSARKIFI